MVHADVIRDGFQLDRTGADSGHRVTRENEAHALSNSPDLVLRCSYVCRRTDVKDDVDDGRSLPTIISFLSENLPEPVRTQP